METPQFLKSFFETLEKSFIPRPRIERQKFKKNNEKYVEELEEFIRKKTKNDKKYNTKNIDKIFEKLYRDNDQKSVDILLRREGIYQNLIKQQEPEPDLKDIGSVAQGYIQRSRK